MNENDYTKVENLKYTLLNMLNARFEEFAASGENLLLLEIARLQQLLARVEERLSQMKAV